MKTFGFRPGDPLASRYAVTGRLGRGAEGEVYEICETGTHLTRAAKLFYPSKDSLSKRIIHYARKLDRLRDCDIVIKYLHTEKISINDCFIHCLISEYFDGVILEDMVTEFPGKRLPTFEALSLIHALTVGISEIHARKEFHGDIHMGNIFVERQGVFFKLRTLDFHDWGRTAAIERRADILAITRLLYDLVGGRKTYRRQPDIIKQICMGLRSDLVLKKFPTIYHLKAHLENFRWD
ncbi:MAG: serine/threonine protein kinase [Parvularculaceae bacterium]